MIQIQCTEILQQQLHEKITGYPLHSLPQVTKNIGLQEAQLSLSNRFIYDSTGLICRLVLAKKSISVFKIVGIPKRDWRQHYELLYMRPQMAFNNLWNLVQQRGGSLDIISEFRL